MPLLSWPELHGALTHFPIVFLLTAPLFDLGAVLLKKPEWRTVSFWMLVGAVLGAVPSLATGWITGNTLFPSGATPPALFYQHRLVAFVLSGAALLLLAWRASSRDQLIGPALIISVALSCILAGGAGFVGFLGGRLVFGGAPEIPVEAKVAPSDAGTQPTSSVDPALVAAGEKLFTSKGCDGCHRYAGKGGGTGPDLTHEARRHPEIDWQIAHLKNPGKMHAGSTMPAYGDIGGPGLKSLAEFLVSRK